MALPRMHLPHSSGCETQTMKCEIFLQCPTLGDLALPKSLVFQQHPFCLFSLKGNALESYPKLSNIQLICWKMLVLAPPSINMLMSFRLHLLFTFWSAAVQGSSFPPFSPWSELVVNLASFSLLFLYVVAN